MSFFVEHNQVFTLEPQDDDSLRECQIGAIWALKSHFTNASNEIASLISMPTGSGKTALMMAACFELNIGKILIVVPSKILRRQLAKQFRSLQILKDIGCIEGEIPEVDVFEVEKRKKTKEEWEEILEENDVVVAHPNSISPYYKSLSPLPVDLIDAVIVDEGHHEPAPTWRALNEFYKQEKRIFFTATPFRRDRKRMRAKLIYHYSIGRALNKGIMRSINFQREAAGLLDPDSALLESAQKVYENEIKEDPDASILIRTDEIEKAKLLAKKYNEEGFNVDVIHSKRSSNVNEDIINEVGANRLDGLVCVGIASEGLDLPNLKIAVLHSTPRSIPYTIQFLGRITRQVEDQTGNATLIANVDEVRGEVSRLFKSDKAWEKLIPPIFNDQMRKARHYRSTHAVETDFKMPELNIFFSALVYKTTIDFNFEQNFEADPGFGAFKILHVEQDSPDSPLVVVTSYDKPLDWANRDIFIEDMLDVHVFYHIPDNNLLFELTTSQVALKSFKDSLIKSEITKIPHGKLYRVLTGFDQNDYIMLGMRNAVMKGSAQPAYKTIVGSEVQTSVNASEGRIFSSGHALINLDRENTWGIATKKSRAWAMKRGTVEEFKEWCDALCELITNGPTVTTLPGLSFLASTEPIDRINDEPMAIIPDDLFFRLFSVTIEVEGGTRFDKRVPEISSGSYNDVEERLECTLSIDDFYCELIMDFDNEDLWIVDTDLNIQVNAQKNEDEPIEGSLEEILNVYPPSLVMKDGSVIEGRNKIIPNRTIEELPDHIWTEKNWANCDITSERYDDDPDPNNIPVINKTIELIDLEFNGTDDILILDDGAHEISDLVWLQGENKIANFIHCKASSGNNPGCRTGDSDVLFAQGLRSIHWIKSTKLMDRLNERVEGNSQIVRGMQNTFEEMCKDYLINEWDYNIILAQPGFDHDQVSHRNRNNNNVYELTIPLYERIISCTADLKIWCHPSP